MKKMGIISIVIASLCIICGCLLLYFSMDLGVFSMVIMVAGPVFSVLAMTGSVIARKEQSGKIGLLLSCISFLLYCYLVIFKNMSVC